MRNSDPSHAWARPCLPGCAVVISLLLCAGSSHAQPYWPQFRGPLGSGATEFGGPPVLFSATNAVWSREVPIGHSSPCIWGSRIFLTSFTDGKLECHAYERATGKQLWVRTAPAGQIETTHAFSNPAAPTPAADSERVVFYFGSYGLLCFTHEGQEVWSKKLPAPVSRGHYGSATSPIFCRDLVILALDTEEGGSRLLALKSNTGEQAWETPRPLFTAGWSTPIVWERQSVCEIVLLGSKKLVAYDPSDGHEVWSVPGLPYETAPSPAFDNERVYVCSTGLGGRSNPKFESMDWSQLAKFDANKDGLVQIAEVPEDFRLVQRPELPEGHPGRMLPFPVRGMLKSRDKNKDDAVSEEEWTEGLAAFEKRDAPMLLAVRAAPSKDEPEDRVVWKHTRGIPEIPSPLCYQGKLFLIRDGGLLQCLQAATGKLLYQERVGVSGGYAASPVAAQGRVYLASQSGTVVVIDAHAENLQVLARNPLGEIITATPGFAEDSIYIRTDKHLFAFGNSHVARK